MAILQYLSDISGLMLHYELDCYQNITQRSNLETHIIQSNEF